MWNYIIAIHIVHVGTQTVKAAGFCFWQIGPSLTSMKTLHILCSRNPSLHECVHYVNVVVLCAMSHEPRAKADGLEDGSTTPRQPPLPLISLHALSLSHISLSLAPPLLLFIHSASLNTCMVCPLLMLWPSSSMHVLQGYQIFDSKTSETRCSKSTATPLQRSALPKLLQPLSINLSVTVWLAIQNTAVY